MADEKSRPLLITIIAILYFVVGILAVLSGIMLMVGGAAVGQLALGGMTGGVLLVVGLINLVIAGGFWNGWKAIWYLAVIFGFIEIILCVADETAGVDHADFAFRIFWVMDATPSGSLQLPHHALCIHQIFRAPQRYEINLSFSH